MVKIRIINALNNKLLIDEWNIIIILLYGEVFYNVYPNNEITHNRVPLTHTAKRN